MRVAEVELVRADFERLKKTVVVWNGALVNARGH